MLRLWWPAFAAAQFVERDFAAALPRLVTADATPNWPREHLAAINRELRAERDRRARVATAGSAPAATTGAMRCRACDWTTWVVVPHPACLAGGQWQSPYRTATVACTRCGPGQRALSANMQAGRNPMTLDTYENHHCPAWAEFLQERAEAERLMRVAESATEVFSPNFPRLVQQIARRAG